MKRLYSFLYAVIIAAMLFLFFTNDFGLVDIRKSSIVVALGIDLEEDDVTVTAQVAVPQPSESGNAAQFAQIGGTGKSVGEALNEINVKSGFYPKLTFCNLILLGESTAAAQLFDLLDYFYRNDYISRTALVAMCKGDASELLAKQSASGEIPAEAIGRTLSEELKRTANVASVNLKEIAVGNKSASGACYLPYVDFAAADGGVSTGSEAAQGSGEMYEYFCNRTVAYSGGQFRGLLDEEQTFALNLLINPVRLAILAVQMGGETYTLGIKNSKGTIKIEGKDGDAKIKASFKGLAELRDGTSDGGGEVIDGAILDAANEKLKGMIEDLFTVCAEADCDILQLKTYARAKKYNFYKTFSDNIYALPLSVEVDIRSKN